MVGVYFCSTNYALSLLTTHKSNTIYNRTATFYVDFHFNMHYYKETGIILFKACYDVYGGIFMKFSRFIGIIIAAATILLAVTGAVTYLLYRISRDKAHNEKWDDYVDCGLA